MTDAERSTTEFADPGDIPRDGPYPSHPYKPLSPSELSATSGATCPNASWKSSATADALASMPFPRPLPPVYKHAVYRASPELGDPKRRMLHVFTVALCTALGTWMVLLMPHDTKLNKGDHVFADIQRWTKRKMGELNKDPAENAANKQAVQTQK